jgi:hypothetical protein
VCGNLFLDPAKMNSKLNEESVGVNFTNVFERVFHTNVFFLVTYCEKTRAKNVGEIDPR